MIIITGVGRCGTSALTKYCKEIGLSIGDGVWHNAYDAGLEDRATVRINNELRKRIISGEFKPNTNWDLYEEIYKMNFAVIKDPQFLVHDSLINEWHFVRKDLKIIYLYRKYNDIVLSLKRVPFMNSPVYRNHVDLIKKHHIDFIKNIQNLKIPFQTFEFPNFINQQKSINKVIFEFLNKRELKMIDKSQLEIVWAKTFDLDKIHFK